MSMNNAIKIFVNAIPKSGLHLAMRCISSFPGVNAGVACPGLHPYLTLNHLDEQLKPTLKMIERGGYFCGHVGYRAMLNQTLKEHSVKTFLVIRDPRDVVVSTLFWIENFPHHSLHKYFTQISSKEEKLGLIICGINSKNLPPELQLASISKCYESFGRWVTEGGACLVRYENLVGPMGGGNLENQKQDVIKMFRFLNMPIDDKSVNQIISTAYNNKEINFRKGKVGGWRDHFSSQTIQTFSSVAAETLVNWGYEM